MNGGLVTKRCGAIGLGLFALYLALGLVRRPEWRANLTWALGSWWRPADREAYWQQASGERIDPWDKILHGHGVEAEQSQIASSMGR